MANRLPPDWFAGITPTLPEWQASFTDAVTRAFNEATTYTDSAVSPVATDLASFKATANAGIASGSSALSSFQATVNAALANGRPQTVKIGTLGWLEALIPGTESAMAGGGLLALSPTGASGGIFGVRSSDTTNTGGMSFAVGSFACNNNALQLQTNYAGYFEARRYPGAGTTQGVEVGMVNFGTAQDTTPYSGTPNQTLAFWASAGRTDVGANNNITLGLGFINNGARFLKGLMFTADSLAGGPAGAPAIVMAYQHAITWHGSGDGGVNAFIRSDTNAASTTGLRGIIFGDTGVIVRTPNGTNAIDASNGLNTLQSTTVNGTLTVTNSLVVGITGYHGIAGATAAGLPAGRAYIDLDNNNAIAVKV